MICQASNRVGGFSGGTAAISEQPTADISFLEDGMERKILLNVVKSDKERCLIEAAADRTVAFQGDAVDAPILCCGHCRAELVVGVDRRRLTNMVIECQRCGSYNDTRELNNGPSDDGRR